MLVYLSYRDYQFSRLHIEPPVREGLVDPELLESDFSALFSLCLILTAFICINLYSRFGTSMFKFDFHPHCPASSEVISEIQCDVRKVEPAVRFVIFVGERITVTVEMLTVEVA